jgi:hypothetical protein
MGIVHDPALAIVDVEDAVAAGHHLLLVVVRGRDLRHVATVTVPTVPRPLVAGVAAATKTIDTAEAMDLLHPDPLIASTLLRLYMEETIRRPHRAIMTIILAGHLPRLRITLNPTSVDLQVHFQTDPVLLRVDATVDAEMKVLQE